MYSILVNQERSFWNRIYIMESMLIYETLYDVKGMGIV